MSVSLDGGVTRSLLNQSLPFTFSQPCDPPDCNNAGNLILMEPNKQVFAKQMVFALAYLNLVEPDVS